MKTLEEDNLSDKNINPEQLYKEAVEKWGARAQLEMAQEEATELALAVRKFIRNNQPDKFEALCSEIADVEIMIAQIKNMFPYVQQIVDKEKIFKLSRLKGRLHNNSFE